MAWQFIAAVEEVSPGQPKILDVNGKSIGIFFERGQYYAVLNYCPHFGAPICQGKVFGKVTSSGPGQQDCDTEAPILRCPWHRWEFDLQTGAAVAPIPQRIKTFPVEVRENGLYIELSGPKKATIDA